MEEGKQNNKQDNQLKPQAEGGAYGKRPLWQWVLIYIIIGGLVYWLIYYVVTADGGSLY